MMIRVNTMPPEERLARTVFGVVMVGAAFVSWGKWIVFMLGIMFLLSAWLGYCSLCEAGRKIFNKNKP